MPLTLDELNRASAAEFTALLTGTYEHSPWVVERAFAKRPFALDRGRYERFGAFMAESGLIPAAPAVNDIAVELQ